MLDAGMVGFDAGIFLSGVRREVGWVGKGKMWNLFGKIPEVDDVHDSW